MAFGDGNATPRGGFASRASRMESAEGRACAFAPRSLRDESVAPQGGSRGSASASRSEGRPARAQTVVPQRQTLQHAKSLAAIAGVAVAVALASVGYGAWASVSSRAVVEDATAGTLPVLVAASDIRAGDRISPDSAEIREIPRAYRSEAMLGIGELSNGDVSRRALVDIPAGTPIAASFVTGARGTGRLAAEIAAGKEAVTVGVDAETGIAGHVRPYDEVRIVSAEGASAGASLLETVCERARVVAVGDETSVGEGAYSSVTVEVSHDEANAVREAQYAGRVSLVLLSADDSLDASAEQTEAPGARDDGEIEEEVSSLG